MTIKHTDLKPARPWDGDGDIPPRDALKVLREYRDRELVRLRRDNDRLRDWIGTLTRAGTRPRNGKESGA